MPNVRIALLLLFATTAAEASTVHARHGKPARRWEARSKLTVIDETHASLQVVVSSTVKGDSEIMLPLALPKGMVATGLAVSIGEEGPLFATVYSPADARSDYDRVVAEIKDPALLEMTSDGRVRLSVFPVRRDAPATVTIELTTIDETGLHVDRETSLMAAPGERHQHARYADYWPAHNSELGVPTIEPDE